MALNREETRCYQLLMSPSLSTLGWTLQKLIHEARIVTSREKTFCRSIHDPMARLERDEVERVIDAVDRQNIFAFRAEDMRDWIFGRLPHPHPAIHELTLSQVLQTNSLEIANLITMIGDYERRGKSQIACAVLPKLGAFEEDFVEEVHRNRTQVLGDKADEARNVLNSFHRQRRKERLSGEGFCGRQTYIILESNLCHVRDGSGLYAGISAELRAYAWETFIREAIYEFEEEVFVIGDHSRPIPKDLIKPFKSIEGLVIIDDQFLLKIPRDARHRSVINSFDGARAEYICGQLAMLDRLKEYVIHDTTQQARSNALLRFLPDSDAFAN